MHTAGHALAESVKKVFPELEPFHGNHDPLDGYVKFKMLLERPLEFTLSPIQSELNAWIQQDVPVEVIKLPSGMRAIQLGGTVMTCGGTHVDNLNTIGKITLTGFSVNQKEKTVTVKYCL